MSVLSLTFPSTTPLPLLSYLITCLLCDWLSILIGCWRPPRVPAHYKASVQHLNVSLLVDFLPPARYIWWQRWDSNPRLRRDCYTHLRYMVKGAVYSHQNELPLESSLRMNWVSLLFVAASHLKASRIFSLSALLLHRRRALNAALDFQQSLNLKQK